METLTSGQRCLDSPGDLSIKGGIEVRGGLFDHQYAVLAGNPFQLHGGSHIGPAEIFQDDAQLVAQRDEGKAVLLVSLELDEVMDVPDRILVMYEGEIVGELDPKTTTQEELGLYMAGAKRDEVKA